MRVANVVGRSLVGFAQQGLELGEDLLDGIEIGRVGRQEEEASALQRGSGGGWHRFCASRGCP